MQMRKNLGCGYLTEAACRKMAGALVIVTLLCSSGRASAQRKGEPVIKTFLQLCNALKQQPLYLKMQIRTSSNYNPGVPDTVESEAEFFVTAEGAYMRYGAMEQIVSDSMALLVNNELHRMILYSDAAPVLERMASMPGVKVDRETTAGLKKKYKAWQEADGDGAQVIIMEAREKLEGSSFSRETVELHYDNRGRQPLKVSATQRTLLPLDEDHYRQLGDQGLASYLIKGSDGFYLVREQTITFDYKIISHQKGIKVPARVGDLVEKSQAGFVAAKDHKDYLLTIN